MICMYCGDMHVLWLRMYCGEIHVLRWHACIVVTCMYCGDMHVLRWHACIVVTCMYCGDMHVLRWHACIAVTCMYCGDMHVCVCIVGSLYSGFTSPRRNELQQEGEVITALFSWHYTHNGLDSCLSHGNKVTRTDNTRVRREAQCIRRYVHTYNYMKRRFNEN